MTTAPDGLARVMRAVALHAVLAVAWLATTVLAWERLPPWAALIAGLATLAATAALLANTTIRHDRAVARRTEVLREFLRHQVVLFERSTEAMFIYDTGTSAMLAVNDAACMLYGFPRDEFLALTVADLRPPERLANPSSSTRDPSPGASPSGRVRHARKDGQIITLTITAHAIESDGRPARLVIAHDETERVRAEQARIELLKRLADTEENARRRISENLHDGPVQTLSAVSLRLELLKRQLPDPGVKTRAEALTNDVNSVIDELRGLMAELRMPDVTSGLSAAIRLYADRSASPETAEVIVSDDTRVEVSERVAQAAYRIAHEAIANARRHSGAKSIDVHLTTLDGALELVVHDDGRGLPDSALTAGDPKHLGLTTMRERAEEVGGSCLIDALPGGGTRVVCALPLDPEPEGL